MNQDYRVLDDLEHSLLPVHIIDLCHSAQALSARDLFQYLNESLVPGFALPHKICLPGHSGYRTKKAKALGVVVEGVHRDVVSVAC